LGSCLFAGCASNTTGAVNPVTETPTSAPVIEKIHFSGSGNSSYFSEKKHFNGGDYKFTWTLKDCDLAEGWLNQLSTQTIFSASDPFNRKNWRGQGYLYGLMENDNFIWVTAGNGACSWAADFTSIQ